MKFQMLVSTVLAATAIVSTGFGNVAGAATFDIPSASGLVVPTFRSNPNTTWTGWDTFDDGDGLDNNPNIVINDNTPNIGTNGGLIRTTNGEDHVSSSYNYYSAGGSVAEEVTFTVNNGGNSGGFTTVIVQGITAFGPFGTTVNFGPIGSFAPTEVFATNNATGNGQFFVKYQVPGTPASPLFTMTSGPFSNQSYDKIVVDTQWSPNGYSTDTAVPEPACCLLAVPALAGVAVTRRRTRS